MICFFNKTDSSIGRNTSNHACQIFCSKSNFETMYHWFFLLEITVVKKWTIWMFARSTAIYTHGPGLSEQATFWSDVSVCFALDRRNLATLQLTTVCRYTSRSTFCWFRAKYSFFLVNKCYMLSNETSNSNSGFPIGIFKLFFKYPFYINIVKPDNESSM